MADYPKAIIVEAKDIPKWDNYDEYYLVNAIVKPQSIKACNVQTFIDKTEVNVK